MSGRSRPPRAKGAAPAAPPPRRDAPARRGGSRLGLPGPGDLWLYGRHPVEAALRNRRREVLRLVGTREALAALEPAMAAAGSRLPPAEVAERADLDGFFPAGTVHQGLALKVAPLPGLGAEDLVALAGTGAQTEAVILVLDQVTDPQNVGAILRSAAAFGALGVLVQDRHSPEETGVLAKAASGALERVPLARVPNLARGLGVLKDAGFWIAGLAADGPATLAGARLSGRVALCLGSEGDGLRRLTREACDHLVRLPMVGGAMESLNVSNAAAVGLYELRRAALEETA
jgi:23S rRNA (guanosine2251-2'-O)-methyltransferase